MRNFATLVLYERHEHPAIGYRAETIDQITNGDLAEGTLGAWELRCWTPANKASGYGVTSDGLVALMGAVFRTIRHCFDEPCSLKLIQRFHCSADEAVAELPEALPLVEHLTIWADAAAMNDVFLQIRNISIEQLLAIENELQREIAVMVKFKDELSGRSHTNTATECGS